MEKRGSHVGMVLSFVIFVTFIVFILSYLEPLIQTNQDKQTILNFVETSLIENISSEFVTVSFVAHDKFKPKDDCFYFSEAEDYENMNFIVKNENGSIRNSGRDFSTNPNRLVLDKTKNEQDFYRVFYSTQPFLESTSPSGDCETPQDPDDITIGQIKNQNNIFESQARELINYIGNYSDNYTEIKNRFNVPSGSEFRFELVYRNGSRIETPEINVTIDVFSEEIPIQFIDKEANLTSGFLVVEVW